MVRTAKQRAASRRNGAKNKGFRHKRRARKIRKLSTVHKRVAGRMKVDFAPDTPLYNSGLHHSVARRHARRGRKIQYLKYKNGVK